MLLWELASRMWEITNPGTEDQLYLKQDDVIWPPHNQSQDDRQSSLCCSAHSHLPPIIHPWLSPLKLLFWDFPGSPAVKNWPSSAGDLGSIPAWGTKIPHAPGQVKPCTTTTDKPACRNQDLTYKQINIKKKKKKKALAPWSAMGSWPVNMNPPSPSVADFLNRATFPFLPTLVS